MKSFQTARLSFTPVALSDTVALHELRSEPEVMKWSVQKHPDTCLQDTEDWIRKATNTIDNPLSRASTTQNQAPSQAQTPQNGVVFSVRELSHLTAMQDSKEQKDRIVAIVGIRETESVISKVMQYELGYMFVPGVWGRGYASEAVRGIVKWWFGYLRELNTPGDFGRKGESEGRVAVADEEGVYAVVAKANGASMRVMEKAGFWKINEGVDGRDENTELVEFCISSSTL